MQWTIKFNKTGKRIDDKIFIKLNKNNNKANWNRSKEII